jgi:hypothetical protein
LDILGAVLRLYSYLYHFVLSAFLFLVSVVVLIGGKHDLRLPMLPWTGEPLTYWVFGLSVTGLLLTILAATGILRVPFPIWCLFVVVMMVRGFFLSPMYYQGPGHFQGAVWLTVGALGAFLSSLMLYKRVDRRRR